MGHDLGEAIGAVVDRYMDGAPTLPAACVAVDGPGDHSMCIARGSADPAADDAMTPDLAVRIASCTKTFVACTVLDLVGRDLLSLDQPAIDAAPPTVVALLDRYADGRVITVRQLLQHRSGLVDHSSFPEFLVPFAGDHTREWTALEQLSIAIQRPPLFAPGEGFSYSDSGYILLGQIIEGCTASTLAEAVRAATHLDGVHVPSIHWERVESAPPGLVRAHQFVDGVDTHDWNPTVDLFGGGGLVATMPDLARWWTALFDGRVHEHLGLQLGDPQPTVGPDGISPGGDATGLGIFHRLVDDVDVWAHGGYWGLTSLHVPAIHTSVALVITGRSDRIPGPSVLADDIVRALIASA